MIGRLMYINIMLSIAMHAIADKNKNISLEDKTKAVFIYHFTKYIQWPGSDTLATFRIAVLGEHPILSPLNEIKKKKNIKGIPIQITSYSSIPDSLNCHILFVSKMKKKHISSLLERTAHKPILTISDTPGFAEAGIAINFFKKNGKIKFEINSTAVHSTHLKISSQLLKLARFVKVNQ